jgi:hypothetical protein
VVKINERIEEGQEAEQRLKWLYVPAYGAESWSKFKQLELPDCLKRADKVPRGPHT